MPFIDCRVSKKLTDEQKEQIKSALGAAVSALHKTESYLMVGIADGYDLYFGGKKLGAGAFVDVRAFGALRAPDCEKMTSLVCDILQNRAGISPSDTYITYQGYENWGWNGSDF